MLKKILPFLLLLSCTKPELEKIGSDPVSAVTVSDNAVGRFAPKFGSSIGGLTGGPQVEVARKLGIQYLRRTMWLDRISVGNLQRMTDSGLKIILNISYTSKRPDPFATNIADYKRKLATLLDSYKPEMIVVKNEELNTGFNSGLPKDYVNELQAAIEVAHARGVKVTNGGLGSVPLILLTYHDYLDRGMKAEADDFAKRMIPDNIVKQSFNRSALIEKLNRAKFYLSNYAKMDVDFVNFHWYAPARIAEDYKDTAIDNQGLHEVVNYIRRVTGKQVMSNEVGALNRSGTVVQKTLQGMYHSNVRYIIWYSSDGGPYSAVALHNLDGTLRPNGNVFRAEVDRLLSK